MHVFCIFVQVHSACPLVGVLLCEVSFELHRAAQSSFELHRAAQGSFELHRGWNAENSGQLGNSMGGDEEEQAYRLDQNMFLTSIIMTKDSGQLGNSMGGDAKRSRHVYMTKCVLKFNGNDKR